MERRGGCGLKEESNRSRARRLNALVRPDEGPKPIADTDSGELQHRARFGGRSVARPVGARRAARRICARSSCSAASDSARPSRPRPIAVNPARLVGAKGRRIAAEPQQRQQSVCSGIESDRSRNAWSAGNGGRPSQMGAGCSRPSGSSPIARGGLGPFATEAARKLTRCSDRQHDEPRETRRSRVLRSPPALPPSAARHQRHPATAAPPRPRRPATLNSPPARTGRQQRIDAATSQRNRHLKTPHASAPFVLAGPTTCRSPRRDRCGSQFRSSCGGPLGVDAGKFHVKRSAAAGN